MIFATDVVKEFIKAQDDKDALAERWGMTTRTLQNIISDEPVSSETIAYILNDTGFSFDKAFEYKIPDRRSKK